MYYTYTAFDDLQRNVVHGFALHNKAKETRLKLIVGVGTFERFSRFFFFCGLALFKRPEPRSRYIYTYNPSDIGLYNFILVGEPLVFVWG